MVFYGRFLTVFADVAKADRFFFVQTEHLFVWPLEKEGRVKREKEKEDEKKRMRKRG